jgi:hypothetical protein
MTARADDKGSSVSPTTLDKSIQVYRDMGYSDARIAAQLIRSGHPVDDVRKRFPDIPLNELPAPSVRRPPRASRPGTERVTSESARAEVANHQVPPAPKSIAAGGSLNRVSDRFAAAPRHLPDAATDSRKQEGETDLDGMSFQYVPLIQCSFPHADPGEQTVFSRRNGWLELTLSTARPDTGLPYGVPARLLTIYCTSEAIRTRSPEIALGSSMHDFLRRLDVPISRGERGSLRVYANQLLRLVHCAISVDENIRDASGRQGLHIRQTLFVDEARLWWDEATGIGRGSSLVLSPVLYQSILERSAPLSTDAIRKLRKSPMDLDVYAWLVHRLFHLSKPSSLTWEQLSGQIGHSYGELRSFRRFFNDSFKRVLQVYPEARVNLSEKGLLLLPSKPHIEPRARVEA